MLRAARLHTVCQDVRQLTRRAPGARTLKHLPLFDSFSGSTCARPFSNKGQICNDSHKVQTKSGNTANGDKAFDIKATSTVKQTFPIDLEPLRAHLREQGQPHSLDSFLLNERQKQLKRDAAECLKAAAGLASRARPPKGLSSTYLGTRYEYLTQSHLSALGFDLIVVGGRGDSGVDLLGTWTLPDRTTLPDSTLPPQDAAPTQRTLKVLVQCKRLASNRTPTPSLIRELEGAISNTALSVSGILPASFRQGQVLGVMVCTRPATEGILKAMRSSRKGLVWICLAEDDVPASGSVEAGDAAFEADSNGAMQALEAGMEALMKAVPRTRVLQMTWNAAASQAGLEGLNVGMRYDGGGGVKDAVLMWQGRPVN